MGCAGSVPQTPPGTAQAGHPPTTRTSTLTSQKDGNGASSGARPIILPAGSQRASANGDHSTTGARMPSMMRTYKEGSSTGSIREGSQSKPAQVGDGTGSGGEALFYNNEQIRQARSTAGSLYGFSVSQEQLDIPADLPPGKPLSYRVLSDSGTGVPSDPPCSVNSSMRGGVLRIGSLQSRQRRPPRASIDAVPRTSEDDALPDGELQEEGYVAKERRHGNEDLMRELLMKMALGRGGGDAEDGAMEISDSDDEIDEDLDLILKQTASELEAEQEHFLMNALRDHFIFRGLSEEMLRLVVQQLSGVCLPAHAIIVEQGSLPRENDCMFIVETGEVEVMIAGGGPIRTDDINQTMDGHLIRMTKGPGWVFGDMTLLFNTPRSASVISKSHCTLWALEKSTFMAIVMKHATGARALRFVRKLPLLKGLSDNVLFDVAERMTEEEYEDGEALIKYGERGHKLFLIRYGRVDVQVPLPNGEKLHVNTLGRGHFVGERTLITNKLRSADCFAHGPVTAVVMMRQDFLQLDNPLLGWMLDYDAMATVMRTLPQLGGLSNDRLEMVIDKFEREDYGKGSIVCVQGDPIHHITVVKMGQVVCVDKEDEVEGFVQDSEGGFCYFGEGCLSGKASYPGSIVTVSPSTTLLTIHRRELLSTLRRMTRDGELGLTDDMKALVCNALQHCKAFHTLSPDDIARLSACFEVWEMSEGELLTEAGDPADQIFVLYSGALASHYPPNVPAPKKPPALAVGGVCGEAETLAETARSHDIVSVGDSIALSLATDTVREVMGMGLQELLRHRMREKQARHDRVAISDLEMFRVVGTGQFGMVRMVRHKQTQEVFALKTLSKAAGMQKKQLEHLRNERIVMEEASSSPFCTRLVQAYQDSNCLYMLQEWVPGGELFYHLDMEGAFDEETAKFYAASTLLALQHLHDRGIIYRDLKPENLLLDRTGNIKMADFGFAKRVGNEKTYTICGTPDYQAPEVIMRKGTTPAADYWALGVLIFEMMVGDPPFKSMSGDPWDTFRRILSGRFYVPDFVPEVAADLIYLLLQTNVDSRLGSGAGGANNIKAHPWFDGFDWEALQARRMRVPIQPVIKNALDTSNFDTFDTEANLPDWVNAPVSRDGNRQDESAYSWDLWEWVDDLH